jgi:DNA-directed RNA polymerase subunit alpha
MTTRIPLIKTDSKAKEMAAKLEMSTAEIGLSVRTTNCLEEKGIFTVEDLLHSTRDDLLSISNFGEKTLEEVYRALEGIGFCRRGQEEPAAAPPRSSPLPR